MTIDVYSQYFSADYTYNNIPRHAAIVKLTSDSEEGNIRYTASVNFFPYNDDEDFGITYDAYFEKELYNSKGRRTKKRELQFLDKLPDTIDSMIKEGTVFWDQPLREARRG